MKRYLATFTVEVYGETEAEAKRNAEGIVEYTEEWLDRTGEEGRHARLVGVAGELPPDADDLEEAREAAEQQARVAAYLKKGDYIEVQFKEGPEKFQYRVVEDNETEIQVRRRGGDDGTLQRYQIEDIERYDPVCGHGVNSFLSRTGCKQCAVDVRNFLHGLIRRPR